MKTAVIVFGAVAALAAFAYYVITGNASEDIEEAADEVEDAGEEASDEIREVGDALDAARQDVLDAADELRELLDQADVPEEAATVLKGVKEFIEGNAEDLSPGVLVERAVKAGDKFGRQFPRHVEDVVKEAEDLHGEFEDISEFFRTFLQSAQRASEIRVEEKSPVPSMKLPKEGEDRFPHIGYLESAGIETYGDLLQHKDDFTAINQIGPSRGEDIEARLRDEGFQV